MTSKAEAKSHAEENSAADVAEKESDPNDLSAQADRVIRHNVYWSAAAGVIPVPVLDTVALIGFQLKMLKELGDVYGVPFKANAVKSAVTALLSGTGTTLLTGGALHSATFVTFLRHSPVIGSFVSLATQPAFAAAFTYAVGRVFKRHFASGGTFLSFNAKAVKEEFAEEFADASKNNASPAAA